MTEPHWGPPHFSCLAFFFVRNFDHSDLAITANLLGTPNQDGLGPGGLPLGDSDVFGKVHQRRTRWQNFIDSSHMKAFIEIVMAPSLRLGVSNLMLAGGLGGMRPNTVCLNFFRDSPKAGRRKRDELNSVWEKKTGRYRVVRECQDWETDAAQDQTPCLEYVQVL